MLREHGQMKKFHHDIIGIGKTRYHSGIYFIIKIINLQKEIAYRKKVFILYKTSF